MTGMFVTGLFLLLLIGAAVMLWQGVTDDATRKPGAAPRD